MRVVRFNLYRGGSSGIDSLQHLARRVFDIAGWHTEIYLDAAQLPDLADQLTSLPALSIDHIGMTAEGLPHLLRLVERGTYVKIDGFGRVQLDLETAIPQLVQANPHALMPATDLPSTRARRPFMPSDLDLLASLVPAEFLDDVFYANAARFYGIDK